MGGIGTEKLKIKAARLLLGRSDGAKAVQWGVRAFRLLGIVLFVSGILNRDVLIYGGAGAVAAVYFTVTVLLNLMLFSLMLERARRFAQLGAGEKTVSGLFERFGFADLVLAVKLALLRYLFAAWRTLAVFTVPGLFALLCFLLLRNGVSTAVAAAVLIGVVVMFGISAVFCRALRVAVNSAYATGCFEEEKVFRAFVKRLRMLDETCFKLLRTGITSGKPLSAQRELSVRIEADRLLGIRQFDG